MNKNIIVAEHVSYAINQQPILRDISISLGSQKTGLVGDNGIGKTTLARLLIGQLMPTVGVVHRTGKIGYVPQDQVVAAGQTVAEVLGIDQKLQALERVEAGCSQESDYDAIGDDWDLKVRMLKLFAQLKLEHIPFSRLFSTLSGGEATRIFWARLLFKEPDFLVLDEPTNNIDAASRETFYALLQEYKGGMVVISHDRTLHSYMDQIMELSSRGLHTYGGNYQAYVEQKNNETQARERQVVTAQLALQKTKHIVQESKKRYEKRANKGDRENYRGGGQPKIFMNFFKNRSGHTQSKLALQSDKLIAQARQRVLDARAQCERTELATFTLSATAVHAKKKVLEIKDLSFTYPGNASLIQHFNFTMTGPARIALIGPNGSGKTTLLRLIMHQLQPTTGAIAIGVEQCAYFDQNLSVLDHQNSILENFKRLNPTVNEAESRRILAAFLFSAEMVKLKIEQLSGGQRMRAALACVLMSATPPQLIILDEPTNSMDLQSIAHLEDALLRYEGALLVVSHDESFLNKIGVEQTISI